MSRKQKKPKEDDNLEGVSLALEAFDADAPTDAYGIDRQIKRLMKARELPPNALRRIRCAIYRAARSALSWKNHKTVNHPRSENATREFFSDLQSLIDLNRRIQGYDVEHAFSVTHRERNDGSSDPLVLSLDDQIDRTEQDIEEIRLLVAQASSRVEEFFGVTYVPEFEKDSGRTILFTRYFIDQLAMEWPGVFGTPLCVGDLSDMVTLTATALSDLRYPLSKSQQQSDDWLSDRIRKQIFQN